jgi:branched-chain amino acid transport system ATP-binding protein
MDESTPLLELHEIALSFAGVQALAATSFKVRQGEICGVIGPNGAGKSSLMNVISGVYRPDSGWLGFQGQRFSYLTPNLAAERGMARTTQNLALFRGLSVLDNVLLGRTLHTRTGFLAHALRIGPAARDERAQRERGREVLRFLELERYQNSLVSQLPYGLQKRVELGRALASEPRLLLLDEPMAGMTAAEKLELCDYIARFRQERGTSVVLIEHDMGVVMDLSDHVVVLDYGRTIADGSPEAVRSDRAVIDAYLGAAH